MAGEAWYLVEDAPVVGELVLTGAEGRHAATVRRTRVGERLVLTDGHGATGSAVVIAVDRSAVTVLVSEVRRVPAPVLSVTVVQALPKGERSDLAVDLLTEAGADRILPWQASRCVARWSGPKVDKGIQKWRTVAREASKQSRRAYLPDIGELMTTRQVVDEIVDADRALVLHEAESRTLKQISLPDTGQLMLIVGPEGGVSPEELAAFAAAGAVPVRLGPEVLRTSSAGAVALGALGVLTDRWS